MMFRRRFIHATYSRETKYLFNTSYISSMNKKLLDDVVIIRLILIILLVLYHSFAIYNGAWDMPNGIHSVNTYYWIASLSYSFLLETFVFVSGYVFGYQVRTKYNNQLSFNNSIIKKAKRLLIPGIIFSLIYFLCFNLKFGYSVRTVIYCIIVGEGHLWYLPMLFSCFAAIYILEKFHLSSRNTIVIALLASLFSLGPLSNLPFRISTTMYYFLFFVIGYLINKSNVSINCLSQPKSILLFFIIWIITFILYQYFSYQHQNIDNYDFPFWLTIMDSLFRRLLRVLQATFGLLMTLGLVKYLIKKSIIHVSSLSIKLSTYCFGVYIFQQFILNFIVTNPFITESLGSYLLPWVSFLFTLIISLLVTGLFLRTRLGRYLIG